MNNSGKRYRDLWKRVLVFALCASISATTIFPDNGVAFAASLEDAVATEETRAANEYAEATEDFCQNPEFRKSIRIRDSDGCGLYVRWKLRRERY